MNASIGRLADQSSRWRLSMYLFCAVAMSYGWGWRGAFGHEAGAMLPGALLGMAICLASGRQDWYGRSVIAGLGGAVGWSWGGTLSNMEQRLYILSDAPVDVIYGFACIGFVGMIWSGVGGAILAMAFTRPRSELNRFIGPLTVMGSAFLLTYLYFCLYPQRYESYVNYSREHWHESDWLAALTTLIVLLPYWFARPSDRPATQLILQCAAAWWVGYLGLTKLGGIELAPPFRSESWAGVLGIQAVLIWHHCRNRDRAAVLFTLYAMLAGCIGFILALQLHVPFVVGWGPCSPLAAWKIAEESFGFFMGFGVAMGAGRLLDGRIAPPAEDDRRDLLDAFGFFVLVIAMMWMNLKTNLSAWRDRYGVMPTEPFAFFKEPFPQLEGWVYFLIVGGLWTALALYCLARYYQGRLALAPNTAFEKGALVFVVLVIVSLAGVIAGRVPAYKDRDSLMGGVSFLILAAIAIWMLLARSDEGLTARESEDMGRSPSDPSWSPGWKYWAVWAWVPFHIVIASAIALAMVKEPWRKAEGKERHRFGPNATWRLELDGVRPDRPRRDADR